MKPLNVRFPDSVNDDIEFISKSGDYSIAKSLIARAAIALGIQQIELARDSMSQDDFILWLDSQQAK
ncbi:hypothetical protein BOX08_gp43 [Pseudoalteromonas phage BS5]|uniref:hypothetical protein n=1 Tax=Pseudoalteromonas phage BS5 TaxID=1874539 RepID=UPI0008199CD4|nr:hypothetical protein BOX08_gp43 [Pseudoalteromonas phage BS5]ANY29608.1 hypothetical protein [Pseudoalteromonas phage BS5]